ncbi:MAG: hypothetical protein ACFHU9_02195 [Fluviicola sp.]
MRSCGNHIEEHYVDSQNVGALATAEDTLNAQKDSLQIESEYDLETVDPKDREEFLESMAKIETEHGVQWGFCECVVKNDSINDALSKELSDAEFDKVLERSDFIEQRCQAFLVQSRNQTPEERYAHEEKVKKCLKEAGRK